LPHDLPHDLERIEVMITASMAADAATSATAEVLLAHFEQTMTMGEALAAGLHVAEWGMADALIRSYGRTPEEARTRLLASIAAEIWILEPDGKCSKADGTVHYR
jgi:hypothetical protein